MSKYFAYVENEGGCDYTIGCNRDLIELQGNSLAEAVEFLRQDICSDKSDGLYFTTSVNELDKITILEVIASVDVDIETIKKEYQQNEQKRKDVEDTESRRVEYERLKVEFG